MNKVSDKDLVEFGNKVWETCQVQYHIHKTTMIELLQQWYVDLQQADFKKIATNLIQTISDQTQSLIVWGHGKLGALLSGN
jgi:hypothetical protein